MRNVGKETSGFHWVNPLLLILPFALVMIALVLFPVLALIVKSLTLNKQLDLELLNFNLLQNSTWTLNNYERLFIQPYYINALLQTLWIAVASIALSAVVGIPIAYVISNRKNRLSQVIRFIITVPLFVPDLVLCYGLLSLLSRHGIVNLFLSEIGIEIPLVYNITGVIIGTFYILFSTFVLIVAAAMERIDYSLREASYTLGASEFITFIKVILPLSIAGIVAAVILLFSAAVGMVVVALILGGGSASIQTYPLEIMAKAGGVGSDFPLVAAMGFILVLITLIGQMIANRIDRRAWSR